MEAYKPVPLLEVGSIEEFRNLSWGLEFIVPINLLSPSQPDDGKLSFSWETPLEVVAMEDKLMIVHGNHRYYEARQVGMGHLKAIKIAEPLL